MKQKNVIIILLLIICILLAVGIDLLIVTKKKENTKVHYSCSGVGEQLTESNEKYQLLTNYEFYFDNTGVTDSKMQQMFFFTSQEFYDSFSYQDFSTEELIEKREIPVALEKSYTLKKSIPADSNKLKSYLKKLTEMNYECQIVK